MLTLFCTNLVKLKLFDSSEGESLHSFLGRREYETCSKMWQRLASNETHTSTKCIDLLT